MKKIRFPNISNFLSTMRLLDSVALVIVSLIIFLLIAISFVFSNHLFDFIRIQKEKTVIQTVKNIAELPGLQLLISDIDKHKTLQDLVMKFDKNSEASFVAVTDSSGMIIAHSKNRLIGKLIKNPYIRQSVEEKNTYVYRYKENSKQYVTGTAPVYDINNKVIGLVSIGYAIEKLRFTTRTYLEKSVFYIFIFIIIGLGAAILIARGVKKAIFGLEPSEIAHMFQARSAIVESIRACVLATDKNGIIILTNTNAKKILSQQEHTIEGRHIDTLFPSNLVNRAMADGLPVHDAEVIVMGISVLCNILPLNYEQQISGVVVTFRKKDEIDMIAGELSQVKHYSQLLRAQTHEYANRLHTIAGMIQTQDYDNILDLIAKETGDQKRITRLLLSVVDDTEIRSLLLGKYMLAKELKIDFLIDPESNMKNIPQNISRHQIVTILGNLIDNAFDATIKTATPRKVLLSMSDFGDLIFEIEDSGSGIHPEIMPHIFERGISTKKDSGHGIGLYLVHQALLSMNGAISIEDSELSGTRFIVTIKILSEGDCGAN